MTTDLPVVDLAPLRGDLASPAAQRTVVELRDACHHVGFAHVVGHGVDATLDDAVHDVSRRFFALDERDRLEIVNTNSPYFRGYTRLGHEHTNGRSDWRDQIDIGPERDPVAAHAGQPVWLRLRGPNQWPSALPELRTTITAWMDAMETVGRTVLRALALGLGQRADAFDAAVAPDPEVLVKIIRYPAPAPAADHDDGQGVGAHHDSGLLTFIHQDHVGGLEVLRGERFVPVTRLPGAYVLNLGEMLQLATGGYLRATKHRVVSPLAGRERISVAYFFNPCMEASFVPVTLPPELAAEAPGGQNANPNDPVFSTYGENWLKFRLRSHPDVARRHHADLTG